MQQNSSTTFEKLTSNEIEAILRERIFTGQYKAKTMMPAERTLANEFGVHRRIIEQALKQIKCDKLITQEPRCRSIVCSPKEILATQRPVANQDHAARCVTLIMRSNDPLEQEISSQMRIFWGLNEALASEGFHAVFFDSRKRINISKKYSEVEREYIEYAIQQNLAGIVLFTSAWDENHDLIRKAASVMPVILIDRKIDSLDLDFVGISNYQATYDMTKMMIELGHERIAFLSRLDPINPVAEREKGYLRAIRHHFHEGYFEMVLHVPTFRELAWPAFRAVFTAEKSLRPTALVCINDFEAFEAAELLDELGLRIPEDVSISGFDNVLSVLHNGLGLTTIAQPFEGIGKEAARLFLRRVREPNAPSEMVFCPTSIIVRESIKTSTEAKPPLPLVTSIGAPDILPEKKKD